MYIFSLALAFYRAPLARQELLKKQKLPEGMNKLLRVAGGNPQFLKEASQACDASPQELHEAAVFFIQQVLFTRDAHHYRLLGLNSDATPIQIKEHHRLLIRLVHPDRQHVGEDWSDAYARRVNEAYNVLRKPETRRAYHASLTKLRDKVPQQPPPARPTPPRYEDPRWVRESIKTGPAPLQLPRFLLRNLPQAVLGGVAIIAFIVVFGIYLSRQQVPVADSEHSAMIGPNDVFANDVGDRMSVPTVQAKLDNPPPAVEYPPESRQLVAVPDKLPVEKSAQPLLIEPLLEPVVGQGDVDSYGPPDSIETAIDVIMPVPAEPVDGMPIPPEPVPLESPANTETTAENALSPVLTTMTAVAADFPDQTIDARLDNSPPAQTVQTDIDQPPAEQPQPAALADVPSKQPSAPVTVAKIEAGKPLPRAKPEPPAIISDLDLEVLTALFVGAYERGSLDELMTLFDEQVRTNHSAGKQIIRGDYRVLFQNTRERKMRFTGLRWHRQGISARGHGIYQLRLRGKQGYKNFTGSVRFEVEKKDGEVLISSFYHKELYRQTEEPSAHYRPDGVR